VAFNYIFSFFLENWFFIFWISLIGYLLGSINFSIIISEKMANGLDIRNTGSGNAGANNVLRILGKKAAALTFLGDFSKGILAVYLGKFFFCNYILVNNLPNFYLEQYGAYLAGLFCFLGHIYPCFFKFKGGKGASTLAAIALMINWQIFIASIGTFLLILLISKIVSLSTIIAAISYFISSFYINFSYFKQGFSKDYNINLTFLLITSFTALFTSFLVIKSHKENIKRILNKKEQKIKEYVK